MAKNTPSVNTSEPAHNEQTSLTWGQRLWIGVWFIGGILVTIGVPSLCFYFEMWPFFIVLFTGTIQGYYALGLSNPTVFININNSYYIETFRAITFPFLIIIAINAWLYLFIFFGSSIITFILCIVYIIIVGGFWYEIIGKGDKTHFFKNFKAIISKKSFIWSFVLILLIYGCIFFSTKIVLALTSFTEQWEYNNKIHKNDELVEMRMNDTLELSFKNIVLGSDYNDLNLQNENFPRYIEDYYTWIISEDMHPIQQIMGNNHVPLIIRNRTDFTNTEISGRVISSRTSLYNKSFSIRIYELNGNIGLISLTPDYGNMTEKDYAPIRTLYITKYGEPEVRNYKGLPLLNDNYYTINQKNLVWTFPKGTIRYGYNRIIYASLEFLDMINNKYNFAVEEANHRRDSIQNAEHLLLQKRQLEDNNRQIRNQKNAINEI